MKCIVMKKLSYLLNQPWYRWLDNAGRMCMPGDTINGDVAIIKKLDVKINDKTKDIQSIS
jgi:hypothetical protein